MKSGSTTTIGFAVLFVTAVVATPSVAAEPKAAFDKAMAEVAKSAMDSAAEATAMEKAIAAARALKPPPAAPDATIAFEGRAEAAAKAAKDKSGFKAAADEFGKAARVAPWVPAYHFNRGVLLEKAEDYTAAKRSLELYLKASPNAPDAREVKKKIAGLDYLASRPKTRANPAPPASIVSPKPAVIADQLYGLWRTRFIPLAINGWNIYELLPNGPNAFTLRFVRSETPDGARITGRHEYRARLNGDNVSGTFYRWIDASPWNCRHPGAEEMIVGRVAESRRTITLTRKWNQEFDVTPCRFVAKSGSETSIFERAR